MDYKFLFLNLKEILINPAKAWETINSENKPVKTINISFLLPLFIVVSISSLLGSLLFINSELSPVYSILTGIKTFLVLYITTYLAALILREITYPLDLGRDFDVSFRIIAFSLTPFIVCQIFSGLFESLLFVNIMGLYGLYIFWTGAEIMLIPPQYKKMPLLIAGIISLMTIYILCSLLLNMLTEKLFYALFT